MAIRLTRRVFLSATAAVGGLRTREVEIEYSVRAPADGKGTRIWIPVPRSDEFQTIGALETAGAPRHRIETAPDGNRMLYTESEGETDIAIRFRAKRLERVHRMRPGARFPDPRCCRGGGRLVPVDGRIREWATRVAAGAGAASAIGKARAIYNHVVATVKYDKSGKGWGRGDIYYACETRRGNCTDFHAIFIGYCRALGIPARFAIGIPLPPERGSGQVQGYHCWAEFWTAETGWVPVDASEAAKDPSRREYFFGAHDENRVEFSRGRDVALAPKQDGVPLNFFVHAYAESGGAVASGVTTTVHYRDLRP